VQFNRTDVYLVNVFHPYHARINELVSALTSRM
jgi:hypothetical protein